MEARRAALAALIGAAVLALGAGQAVAQSSPEPDAPKQAPETADKADTPVNEPTPLAERVATLVVLDKFTSTTQVVEVNPGSEVIYGRLRIHVRSCEAAPPWERPEAAAFLQVDEETRQGEVKRVYSGWMFARAPSLHPFDHPAYNVMLKDCKMNFPESGGGTSSGRKPAASSDEGGDD